MNLPGCQGCLLHFWRSAMLSLFYKGWWQEGSKCCITRYLLLLFPHCSWVLVNGGWAQFQHMAFSLHNEDWFFFLCVRLLSFCLHLHAFHLSFCLAILPHKLTYLFSSQILAGCPCLLWCMISQSLMLISGQDESLTTCSCQMMLQFYHVGQKMGTMLVYLPQVPGLVLEILMCSLEAGCRTKAALCGVLNVCCFTCLKLSKNVGSKKVLSQRNLS